MVCLKVSWPRTEFKVFLKVSSIGDKWKAIWISSRWVKTSQKGWVDESDEVVAGERPGFRDGSVEDTAAGEHVVCLLLGCR